MKKCMKWGQRALVLVLVLMMCVGMLPAKVFGDDADEDGELINTATEGESEVSTNPPVVEQEALYLVQWLDKEGNEIKETEYRTGAVGKTVVAAEDDKADIANGSITYKFDADNTGNVLEGNLSTDDVVVLKLYFNMDTDADDDADTDTDTDTTPFGTPDDTPKTGDSSSTFLWLLFCIVSMGGMAVLYLPCKKYQK